MRNCLIYLLLIMFVGGHVLSDTYQHYNNGVTNSKVTTVVYDSKSKRLGSIGKFAQALKAASGNEFPQNQVPAVKKATHLHCTADCGLASAEFASYHPGPRQYLAPPNDASTILNTATDLFRPPIS